MIVQEKRATANRLRAVLVGVTMSSPLLWDRSAEGLQGEGRLDPGTMFHARRRIPLAIVF